NAHGVRAVEFQTHVHLHTANGREIVALGIEEQRVEHRLRRIKGRRLTGAHDAIDVKQRILAALVLVGHKGVADVGADVHMVDIEEIDLVETRVEQNLERLLVNLVAGFEENLAGFHVDHVLGEIHAEQIFFRRADRLQALLGQLTRLTSGHLAAGLDNNFAAIGVDDVGGRLHAAEALSRERDAPVLTVTDEGELVVEGRQDLFAVHAKGHEQRRHRQLTTAVNTRKDHVLGIELDVKAGTEVRNDARGEEQLARRVRLARVMVEEDARRAVHLGNDYALGTVDDEGAVVGHERHVAHVNVLLLDVADRLRTGVLVDIEHDQSQRHLERRGEGQIPLPTLVNIKFRRFELILDEFEHSRASEILNWKH